MQHFLPEQKPKLIWGISPAPWNPRIHKIATIDKYARACQTDRKIALSPHVWALLFVYCIFIDLFHFGHEAGRHRYSSFILCLPVFVLYFTIKGRGTVTGYPIPVRVLLRIMLMFYTIIAYTPMESRSYSFCLG